ncbi:DUF7537 family lipoprotein [Halanaeroarchaeum sulfurireducens]|uniref:Lipoprotein n=1 Tax=Halanaeroarchaeum sulfurireducens TaxID=1604004 RepID=A0A0F7PFW3_9EURY|nr:hypothetical protein [Halanaeroarchaeum sulfurireducens]AKH98168.1 hypothetical protein HLASF_1692 [Halanaeroarchaeum sulfurireducens]ALG82562.1 hypothetical protein HLASA_1679 [Halanaeroarchaeum sulfurireducens]
MHARTRTVAILALVVVTAGCLSAPGAGSSIDASAHDRALESAGSYTYTVQAAATVDGQAAGTSNLTAAVDQDNDRALIETTSAYGPVESYVANDTVVQRIGIEPPQYRTLETDMSAGDVVSTGVAPVVANHSFEANGTGTVDGQQVEIYEANATGANASLRQDLGEGVAVESVQVTLAVRQDGLVLRQQTTAELSLAGGETAGTYTRTVTFSDVGSTDVPTPDWLSEATDAASADA